MANMTRSRFRRYFTASLASAVLVFVFVALVLMVAGNNRGMQALVTVVLFGFGVLMYLIERRR